MPGPRQSLSILALAALLLPLGGCLLTKTVTVPMRVGGAAMSVIPIAGDAADESIDTTADGIDRLPF